MGIEERDLYKLEPFIGPLLKSSFMEVKLILLTKLWCFNESVD